MTVRVVLADNHGLVTDTAVTMPYPYPLPETLADLVSIVSPILAGSRDGGTLLVTPAVARSLRLTGDEPAADVAADSEVTRQLRGMGWELSGVRGWTQLRGRHRPDVHIAMLGWLRARTDQDPLITPDDYVTLGAASRWWHLVGSHYWGGPGVAGIALLRQIHAGSQVEPTWFPNVPEELERLHEVDLRMNHWMGDPGEGGAVYAHAYDVNRMYLSAAMVAGTGNLSPRWRKVAEFDPGLSGWWEVDCAPWPEDHIPLPDPRGYGRREQLPDGGERMWLTTPTLELLRWLTNKGFYGGFSVRRAWVCPSRRVLRPWAERIRDALAMPVHSQADDAVRAALRGAYTRGIGLMYRQGGRVRRPDWYSTVVATARCNLWRRLYKVWDLDKARLIGVDVDCLWYASDEPDPVRAAPAHLPLESRAGSGQLGKFKIRGTKRIDVPDDPTDGDDR